MPGRAINNAHLIAERIRAAVERDPEVARTVSIGMASLEQGPTDLAELISWAIARPMLRKRQDTTACTVTLVSRLLIEQLDEPTLDWRAANQARR